MKLVLGLGTNLGDREQNLRAAEELLVPHLGRVVAHSKVYETEPLALPEDDAGDIPKYLNSALMFDSELRPTEILSIIREVEQAIGRRRESEQRRWQPRIIDIDLLLIDRCIVSEPGLEVPHPELHKRKFVLEPLADIWPDWEHPLLEQTVQELLDELPNHCC